MPCPAEQLFAWHEQPDALTLLLPPGAPVRILHHDGHIRDGATAVLSVGYPPLAFRWELRHIDYRRGRQFCDIQVRGPFESWQHVHSMETTDRESSILRDRIEFVMPMGWLGYLLGRWLVLPRLKKLFTYRHTVTREALSR
jgi:hypothetical protein